MGSHQRNGFHPGLSIKNALPGDSLNIASSGQCVVNQAKITGDDGMNPSQ